MPLVARIRRNADALRLAWRGAALGAGVSLIAALAACNGGLTTVSSSNNPGPPVWTQLSVGLVHMLGIKSDGTLWSWGDDSFGELGDNLDGFSKSRPYQIGSATDWMMVAAGSQSSMALKTDGSLYAWGDNGQGEFGNGTTNGVPTPQTPTLIGGYGPFKFIAKCPQISLAIKTSDSSLWVAGSNGSVASSQTTWAMVDNNRQYIAVTCGDGAAVAIGADHELYPWGDNTFGELGDGSNTSRNPGAFPYALSAVDSAHLYKAVAMGGRHTVGIQTDGSLWSWGSNAAGQMGQGALSGSLLPEQVGTLTDWTQIAAGLSYTLALHSDSSMSVFGDGTNFALGNNSTVNQNTPGALGALPTGWNSVSAYPDVSANSSGGVRADGTIGVFGRNTAGELGIGSQVDQPVPTEVR
jgi:alpha-tubulin suppressor-like RCC1 family protein